MRNIMGANIAILKRPTREFVLRIKVKTMRILSPQQLEAKSKHCLNDLRQKFFN